MTIAYTPGSLIRQALQAQGMTQADLARAAGLSPKHISLLVTGQTTLTVDVALKIEAALAFPADVLLSAETAYRLAMARLSA